MMDRIEQSLWILLLLGLIALLAAMIHWGLTH